MKGRGKGPPPPPLSSRPSPIEERLQRCAAAPAAAAAAPGLLGALAGHQFRRTDVVTKVTSRADVERALQGWVPSRVREAREAWARSYGLTAAAGAACPSPRLRFREEPEVLCVDAENGCPGATAPWSLGQGVAKRYRAALAARWEAEGAAAVLGDFPPLPQGHSAEEVWRVLEPGQRFLAAPQVLRADDAELPARAQGSVRFVCVSDTHGLHRRLPPLPPGDVLLHAGDFSMRGELGQVRDFGEWLRDLPFALKVVIAGNHDLSFAEASGGGEAALREAAGEGLAYLRDSELHYRGLRLYGSPWQPAFGPWAFGLQRGPDIAERWAGIPAGVDVLLVHGPPLGRGDRVRGGKRAGCADLLKAVQGRIRPSFCVSGHIHEDPGVSSDGRTAFVNAASCDVHYECSRAAFVFDLPAREES